MTGETRPKIVVLGGGLGGTIAAYDLQEKVGHRATVHVISNSPRFSFVPSNPWVAVGWRQPEAGEVELAPVLARRKTGFTPVAAARLVAAENRMELADGSS